MKGIYVNAEHGRLCCSETLAVGPTRDNSIYG